MSSEDRRGPFEDEGYSVGSFAPPGPGVGTWEELEHDALVAGALRRERVPGRHGLWFAFRTLYPNARS